MSLTKALRSGLGGVAGMIAANNPELLKATGVLGNIAANRLENEEERKQRAMAEAQSGKAPGVPQPGMKKGGKVKSASARADGCAIRGKTRA